MNPRPILIATCCALALVAFVYFLGKQHFSPPVDGPQPVTVGMKATGNSPSEMPNTDDPNTLPKCPGCGEAFDPANPGLHNSKMEVCVETHNGQPCIETNMWKCQHVHMFRDGTTDETARQTSMDETARQTSMDEAGRYTSGPYKGLTFEQAQKVYQWRVRTGELQDWLIENSKKSRAITNALVASAEEEMSLRLSAFKLLSPDELEQVRIEAEKELPAETVNTFFDNLANHSITMTPEAIIEAEKVMISARNRLWTTRDQLSEEFEQIETEMDEHKRNYPQF
jgi:hypothetical protein